MFIICSLLALKNPPGTQGSQQAALHPTGTPGHTTAHSWVRVPIYASTRCSPAAAVYNPIEDIQTTKNH